MITIAYIYCRNDTSPKSPYDIYKALLITKEREWTEDIKEMHKEIDETWEEEYGIIYSRENEPIWGYNFITDSIIESEDEIRRIYLQMMAQREVFYVAGSPPEAKYLWYAQPNDESSPY